MATLLALLVDDADTRPLRLVGRLLVLSALAALVTLATPLASGG